MCIQVDINTLMHSVEKTLRWRSQNDISNKEKGIFTDKYIQFTKDRKILF